MLGEPSTTWRDVKDDSLDSSGSRRLLGKAEVSLGDGGLVLESTLVGNFWTRAHSIRALPLN